VSAKNTAHPTAAPDWGFWHPGQFGQDYKNLFGEMPSETVSRAELIF
tara:strand:- start:429 stop:569 length:141 start_codon:yes stop_codon:yes gene_type:complete